MRGPKPAPRAERFWAHVEKTETCWLWTGTRAKRGGYGTFYDDPGFGGRLRRANRVAYELSRDVRLPDPTVVVRHTCDTPRCVRPDHLVLGTQANNLEDMRERNRGSTPPHSRGEARYNAKLTDEIVAAAKREHAAGASYSALARKYGVSRPCITYAIKGSTWAHTS